MRPTKVIIPLVFLLFFSCTENKVKDKYPENLPEVSSAIVPFHRALFETENIDSLLAIYPVISNILFTHILGLDPTDSDKYKMGIDRFLHDLPTVNIARLIDSVYYDLTPMQDDWNRCMARYKYSFPDRSIPVVYTLQTNLGLANFMFEDAQGNDAVGISLDFFLGDAYPYLALAKENPAFSQYNSRTFNRDHWLPKTLNAVLDDMLGEVLENNFLHLMIRDGKRLYLLDQLCPQVSDTAIFEYTPAQLDWCQNNEYEIWNFFLESDLIYENSMLKIAKYLQPAPTSQGMPPESPGRTGAYIGYKIVEAFMEKNQGLDLSHLVTLNNAQEILERSKYKPRLK